MGFTELQKEVELLDAEGQKRLMGYLVSLQIRRNDEYRAELTRQLDQEDRTKWISFDEVEKRLKNR
jgi:hypothetical protein|tara:strand:- start:385 stop:582 length:198 start_codon:yes stop_codon:yes gene_type:complete